MEEEKDQLIKRVERLKKRVSLTVRSLDAWKALGFTEEWKHDLRHILSASLIELTRT